MFLLLTSWNEFPGMPMEVPLDGSIMRDAYKGTHMKQITTENMYESTT
jgi:hypothetical protein